MCNTNQPNQPTKTSSQRHPVCKSPPPTCFRRIASKASFRLLGSKELRKSKASSRTPKRLAPRLMQHLKMEGNMEGNMHFTMYFHVFCLMSWVLMRKNHPKQTVNSIEQKKTRHRKITQNTNVLNSASALVPDRAKTCAALLRVSTSGWGPLCLMPRLSGGPVMLRLALPAASAVHVFAQQTTTALVKHWIM